MSNYCIQKAGPGDGRINLRKLYLQALIIPIAVKGRTDKRAVCAKPNVTCMYRVTG